MQTKYTKVYIFFAYLQKKLQLCPVFANPTNTIYLLYAPYLPPVSIGTSLEPHWNFIGTSPRDDREMTER